MKETVTAGLHGEHREEQGTPAGTLAVQDVPPKGYAETCVVGMDGRPGQGRSSAGEAEENHVPVDFQKYFICPF